MTAQRTSGTRPPAPCAKLSGTGGLDDVANSTESHVLAVCSDRNLSLFDVNLGEPALPTASACRH